VASTKHPLMGGLGSRVVPEKVSPAWSPFDEQIITERTPLITLTSISPLSTLRNVTTGTPAHTGSEYLLEADDRIESADIGRYVPGFGAQAGLAVRVATPPTGDELDCTCGPRVEWHDPDSGEPFDMPMVSHSALDGRD